MRAVLQVERVQPVGQALRAVVVPGHRIERLLVVADHRGAEDAPLRIVRAPHVDVFAALAGLSQPCRPQRHGPAVGPRCCLVGVVDVHRVVHRREDDGVECALHERRVRIASRVDAQAGDVEGLRNDLTVCVERPELSESSRADGGRVQHGLGQRRAQASVVVMVGEDVDRRLCVDTHEHGERDGSHSDAS
jgi:hypothetical protein